eukprot:TRINITY_DN17131_c0_g1_i1.p1 TRINITY_DN17131_c0_g1~~TRINITY_DN17131_c0_g1_i1.p1  ORF type:complete len:456 (+),score=92.87 TRINITY_DN17131_c0_g1_i1:48-1370(+)
MKIPTQGVLRGCGGDVSCIDVNPGGELVLTGSSNGEVGVWSVNLMRRVFQLDNQHGGMGLLAVEWARPHDTEMKHIQYPPSTQYFTMGRDGCIRFWSVVNKQTGTFVDLTETITTTAPTGVPTMQSAVPSSTPSLPPPQADYSDMVFSSKQSSDTTFSWGPTTYCITCVGVLWHSSYSFCPFSTIRNEKGVFLAAPSEAGSVVRVYLLATESTDEADAAEASVLTKPKNPRSENVDALLEEISKRKGGSETTGRFYCDVCPIPGQEVGMVMTVDGSRGMGDLLAVGYESGHVMVSGFSLTSSEKMSPVYVKHHAETVLVVKLVCVKSGRNLLLTASADDALMVYHVASSSLVALHTITLPSPGVNALAVHPAKPRLVVLGSWANQALVYDVKKGQLVAVLEEHSKAVSSLRWVQTGSELQKACLFTGGSDGVVALWNIFN